MSLANFVKLGIRHQHSLPALGIYDCTTAFMLYFHSCLLRLHQAFQVKSRFSVSHGPELSSSF